MMAFRFSFLSALSATLILTAVLAQQSTPLPSLTVQASPSSISQSPNGVETPASPTASGAALPSVTTLPSSEPIAAPPSTDSPAAPSESAAVVPATAVPSALAASSISPTPSDSSAAESTNGVNPPVTTPITTPVITPSDEPEADEPEAVASDEPINTDGESSSGRTVGYVVASIALVGVALVGGLLAFGVSVKTSSSAGEAYTAAAGTGGAVEASGVAGPSAEV